MNPLGRIRTAIEKARPAKKLIRGRVSLIKAHTRAIVVQTIAGKSLIRYVVNIKYNGDIASRLVASNENRDDKPVIRASE